MIDREETSKRDRTGGEKEVDKQRERGSSQWPRIKDDCATRSVLMLIQPHGQQVLLRFSRQLILPSKERFQRELSKSA